jgi:hypothetical protein
MERRTVKGHQLESAWTDANWPFTAEQDLAVFLHLAREFFEAKPTSPLPAFEVLNYIACYYWRSDRTPETVSVPFWAVEVIASGYNLYREGHTGSSKAKPKFGEALGLEGGGQGKRPRIQDALNFRRNIRIAIHIVLLEEQGWKIEAALQKIADDSGIHPNTIRNVWAERAEQARRALRLFRSNPGPSA